MTDEERHRAYQAEAGPVLEEYFKKLEDCRERHKNDDTPHGRDDGPRYGRVECNQPGNA